MVRSVSIQILLHDDQLRHERLVNEWFDVVEARSAYAKE